jgi:hypothetical protein
MDLSKTFWKGLLATTAAIAIAGVAGAIFDSNDTIVPDSPNYNGSGGWVNGAGAEFSSGVYFMCANIDNDFTVQCETEHPDAVSVSASAVKVNQRRKENNARVFIDVTEMGGIVMDAVYDLECERVQITGRSNERMDRIESQCTLKGCMVPDELTLDQIRSAEVCIEQAEQIHNIGQNVTTLKLKANDLLAGKIRSKGVRD